MTGKGGFDHKAVVDGLFDGVYYVDLYRTIRYWNPAAERLTGYGSDRAVGTRCSDNLLMHVDADGNSLCQTACPLAHTMADGRVREARVFLHHRDGHRLPVTVRALPMRDRDGKMIGAVEVFSDATGEVQSHEKIEELERLVLLDALTELGNRRMAEMGLRAKLEEFTRYGWVFGVLLVDVDHFKLVNDTHGHDVGDAVLRMVAKTLAFGARRTDTVARWGGEEFLLLMAVGTPQGLRDMTERLRRLVQESSLDVEGRQIAVTVTIGATLMRTGDTAESVVRRVDELLYAGKNGGRNTVMVDA